MDEPPRRLAPSPSVGGGDFTIAGGFLGYAFMACVAILNWVHPGVAVGFMIFGIVAGALLGSFIGRLFYSLLEIVDGANAAIYRRRQSKRRG